LNRRGEPEFFKDICAQDHPRGVSSSLASWELSVTYGLLLVVDSLLTSKSVYLQLRISVLIFASVRACNNFTYIREKLAHVTIFGFVENAIL
jgi:hypothetical protein